MKILFYLAFLLAIISCSGNRERTSANDSIPEASSPEDVYDDPDEQEGTSGNFSENGDSLTIGEFEIEIVLSDAAEKKLNAAGETIIVQAYLSGIPREGLNIEVDEMGEMYLGEPRVELSGTRVARFENLNISRSSYEALADKDLNVLINVFSGRRTTDLNLLDCEILEEPMSAVIGRRHVLKGKLIGE